MTWSVGNKNRMNIINVSRKTKRSNSDVTRAFLKSEKRFSTWSPRNRHAKKGRTLWRSLLGATFSLAACSPEKHWKKRHWHSGVKKLYVDLKHSKHWPIETVWYHLLLLSTCMSSDLYCSDVLHQLVSCGSSQQNRVHPFILQTPSCGNLQHREKSWMQSLSSNVEWTHRLYFRKQVYCELWVC